VFGLILKLASPELSGQGNMVAIDSLELTPDGLRMLPNTSPTTPPDDQSVVLLERDLLDQQIIDVDGRKVVRVNDVNLSWEPSLDSPSKVTLRITEVEVGLRGAMRRLLKGLPSAAVEHIALRTKASIIPWEFVDL